MRYTPMRIKMMFAAVMLGISTMGAPAQAKMAPSPEVVGTQADPAKAIDAMLTVFEHEAMGVVKTMPAERFGFAPTHATFAATQGENFDGVRTFEQQVAHVAQTNYYYFSKVSGMKPDIDIAKMDKLTGKDQVVAALAGSFAFGHKALATITAQNAFTVIKGVDGLHTRAMLAAFAVAHGYDHYGQMVVYLRMNGLIPPS
jgi:uncharacterized damage-inducible protein DinB